MNTIKEQIDNKRFVSMTFSLTGDIMSVEIDTTHMYKQERIDLVKAIYQGIQNTLENVSQ